MKIIVMIMNLIKSLIYNVFLQLDIDPGEAINSLRQNNAVVGILYIIVMAEAAIIIKLWTMVNNLNKERIEDLKARIKAEEDLRKEIREVYERLNLDNKRK